MSDECDALAHQIFLSEIKLKAMQKEFSLKEHELRTIKTELKLKRVVNFALKGKKFDRFIYI